MSEHVRAMQASEYLEQDLAQKENREGRIDRSVRELQKLWSEPDYMDFAERYGDYICTYEKRHDRAQPASVAVKEDGELPNRPLKTFNEWRDGAIVSEVFEAGASAYMDAQDRTISTLRATMQADKERIEGLEYEIKYQLNQLGRCYELTGADTDGDEPWRLAPYAAIEVQRLRQEHDEADTEVLKLQAELLVLRSVEVGERPQALRADCFERDVRVCNADVVEEFIDKLLAVINSGTAPAPQPGDSSTPDLPSR